MGRANHKRQQRTRRRQRDTQLARALERLDTGDLVACERLTRTLAKSWPQCPDVAVLTARVALARGHTDQAISYLQQVLARDPEHVDAAFYLASALFDSGDYHAGLAALTPVLALAEVPACIHHLRARIALAQSEPALACRHAAAACESDVISLRFLLTHCKALALSGQRGQARLLLDERALSRGIDEADAWQSIADIGELLEDTALAERGWSEVRRLDPGRVGQIYAAGLHYFGQSEFALAAHRFRQCWRLAPSDRRVVNALLSALRRLPHDNKDPQLQQELARCLAHEGIDPNHLRDVASRQVLRNPVMARLRTLSLA